MPDSVFLQSSAGLLKRDHVCAQTIAARFAVKHGKQNLRDINQIGSCSAHFCISDTVPSVGPPSTTLIYVILPEYSGQIYAYSGNRRFFRTRIQLALLIFKQSKISKILYFLFPIQDSVVRLSIMGSFHLDNLSLLRPQSKRIIVRK